jgi:hypothetical protein
MAFVMLIILAVIAIAAVGTLCAMDICGCGPKYPQFNTSHSNKTKPPDNLDAERVINL